MTVRDLSAQCLQKKKDFLRGTVVDIQHQLQENVGIVDFFSIKLCSEFTPDDKFLTA